MQPNFKKWLWPTLFLALVFGFLIFWRLDRFSLWHDEADLSLLSKSVLQNGLPLALVDGKFITQWNGAESTSHYLWFFDTAPFLYLRAASFKLFGVNAWAARFPFALLGFLSIVPLGFLFWRWTRNAAVTWLSLFLFAFNPWVLLYIRQSKTYPINFFGIGLLLLGFLNWEEKKKGTLLYAVGLILLFHANYFICFLSLGGLALYTLFFAEGKEIKIRALLTTIVTVALFCLPFFLIGSFETRTNMMTHFPTVVQYFKKFGTHLFYFNRQIVPLILVFVWIYWWRTSQWFLVQKKTLLLITCIVLVGWFGVPILNFDVLRYGFQLFPLLCFLMAVTLLQIYKKNKIAGVLSFVILWGTGLFQSFTLIKPEWPAMKNYYLKEYADPIQIIPKMVAEKWKPGEYVYLNSSQHVWQFYSDIPLAYIAEPEKISPKVPPLEKRWTDRQVIRWWIGPDRVGLAEGPHISEEEIKKEWEAEGHAYEIIDTQIPVLNWDLNSPIRYKHFLERFGDRPPHEETIQLLHRLK
ncbi:MAG: hypothetical protein HY877_09125 [Deltaproteobacteria bacterium]|nr:hypothetical protein [Deltaproteobacteria bacterium]